MKPGRYQDRFALVILLSLLIHSLIVALLLWSPLFEVKPLPKKDKIVVQLKKHLKPDLKKQEQQAKKAEAKKAEAKKAEAKKAEAKKAEAKKAKAKKAEAKKAEAKKAKAKKAKAKKAEAKKAKAKKAEAKKAKAKKAEAKKAEAKGNLHKNVPPTKGQKPQKRLGTMQIMDERALSQMVVASRSLDKRFDKRNLVGERLKKNLNFFQRQTFNATLKNAYARISKNIHAPHWDGKKYYGEINFYMDLDGFIIKIVLKTPSGHKGLDQAFINALKLTKRIKMPSDEQTKKVMYLTRKLLYYDQSDMIQ